MDLMRSILLAAEDESGDMWKSLRKKGYSEEQVGFHTYLLGRAGLLSTIESQGDKDRYPSADVLHITWNGYDFLEAVRKPAIWEAAKRKVVENGVGMTIELLKSAVLAVSKSAIEALTR